MPCSEKCKCKQCRNTFGYWHGGDQVPADSVYLNPIATASTSMPLPAGFGSDGFVVQEDADEEEEEDPRPHKRTKGENIFRRLSP